MGFTCSKQWKRDIDLLTAAEVPPEKMTARPHGLELAAVFGSESWHVWDETGEEWKFLNYLRFWYDRVDGNQKSGKLTSWICKYPIIYQGFIHPRWWSPDFFHQQYHLYLQWRLFVFTPVFSLKIGESRLNFPWCHLFGNQASRLPCVWTAGVNWLKLHGGVPSITIQAFDPSQFPGVFFEDLLV